MPSTFTVALDTTAETMNNAAIRLLGLSPKDIELMVTEIIVGQLRLTVASFDPARIGCGSARKSIAPQCLCRD